jgi:hypothetical protein
VHRFRQQRHVRSRRCWSRCIRNLLHGVERCGIHHAIPQLNTWGTASQGNNFCCGLSDLSVTSPSFFTAIGVNDADHGNDVNLSIGIGVTCNTNIVGGEGEDWLVGRMTPTAVTISTGWAEPTMLTVLKGDGGYGYLLAYQGNDLLCGGPD